MSNKRSIGILATIGPMRSGVGCKTPRGSGGGVSVLGLGAVTAAAVAAVLGGCGGSAVKASTASPRPTAAELAPAPLETTLDRDRDRDIEAPADDTVHTEPTTFGHPASPSDRRAIVNLIERYYAAMLAADGARGCQLILASIAESAYEDDVHEPGAPAYMLGAKTCPEIMTRLYTHYHLVLAAELPKLDVYSVRLEEHHGFAFMRFGKLPERKISVQREGGAWKMSQVYDQEMP